MNMLKNHIGIMGTPGYVESYGTSVEHKLSNDMYSYKKPLVQASMNRYWGSGFITNLRLSKSWSNYENEDLFFGDKRKDREEQVELTVMNQRLNFKGLAPKLHLGKIKHKSNLNYYAYDRSYDKVSFSRNF